MLVQHYKKSLLLFLIWFSPFLHAQVTLGIERIFSEPYSVELHGKKIGLVTNLSAVNCNREDAFELFFKHQNSLDYQLQAIFAPEHGFGAKLAAFEHVENSNISDIPIYSLHGKTKRPTNEMLKGIDLIIFDMQTVGVRCYTYETTLTYVMEEAAKRRIPVIVLDRPNPRGGVVVEGSSTLKQYRCFFTYNQVPFCHGFTIGELANFVNDQQEIGCQLKVIPMLGWKRSMTFKESKLPWIAPSPNIPDSETSLVYPATIVLGETLEIVSVDLRGEKPFKRLGAPWVDSHELANLLNQKNLPGVVFHPETFIPKWGKYQSESCQGVVLHVNSIEIFQPLLTQYTIFEVLQSAYPQDFKRELQAASQKRRHKACNHILGNGRLIDLINLNRPLVEELKLHEEMYIKDFLKLRKKYLLY